MNDGEGEVVTVIIEFSGHMDARARIVRFIFFTRERFSTKKLVKQSRLTMWWENVK